MDNLKDGIKWIKVCGAQMIIMTQYVRIMLVMSMVIRGDDNMEEGFYIIFDTLHQIACF